MELPYGDDGLGRKEATKGDADVPISIRVFRVANLLQVVASSPHPAAVPNLRATKVGRDGRATLMITARLRTHPRSLPSLSSIVRYFRLHPLTRGLGLHRTEVSVFGRSGLSPLHLRLVKKQTRSTPLRSLPSFVPLDRNCQTDICILAFLSVPISAQRANMLHREERGRGNKCQFGYTQWRQFAYNGRENIPPWPTPRRRMKGANSIASPVTYTPLYRAAAAALKLTAAPPTTMLTPLLTTAATPPFAWE